jgi:hypothetical protein
VKYDPQRDRVYSLEGEAHGPVTNDITLKRATRVAQRIFDEFSVPMIPIMFEWAPESRHGGYVRMQYIVLNARTGGCNLPTLLHECAHHIIHTTFDGAQDHGRQFAHLLRSLFSAYRVLRKADFDTLARKHKVKHGW